MKYSDLKHKIKVFSKTNSTDEAGGNITSYVLLFETYASVKKLSTKRMFLQSLDVNKTTYEIVIRYKENREPKQNYGYEINNRRYQMIGVAENVNNQYFKLLISDTNG